MSKRSITLFILFMLLAAGFAGNIHAASHKRKKKHKKHAEIAAADNTTVDTAVHYTRKEQRKMLRHERKRARQERKARKHGHSMESTKPQPVKAHAFKFRPTEMKQRYRVDVLAAMYLDELVKKGTITFKDKIPDKAVPGISFYEGLSIAADSLKKAGFNIDIYVHDVASTAENPDTLLSKGTLDSADLIIGAVPAQNVAALAAYAKSRKVNFVSALSPFDGGVKDNGYFTLIQPSLKTHCEWILSDISAKFPGMKLALLYRNASENDEHAYKFLTEGGDKVNFRQLNCNTLPPKDSLIPLFDTTKPNVLIVSLLEPGAADSLLKRLSRYFPGTQFEVYGMPSWSVVPSLRKENTLPNLTVNVTTPFDIDASGPVGKYVAQTYKADYGGKASEYVYRGYETMFWYANLLKQYGTVFNTRYDDVSAAPFTKFEVKQRHDDKGHVLFNENMHVYLSKYDGGMIRTE